MVLVPGALWTLSLTDVGFRASSIGLIIFFVTSKETTNILCDQPLGRICFSLQILSAGLCEWSLTTGAMVATSCPPYAELR